MARGGKGRSGDGRGGPGQATQERQATAVADVAESARQALDRRALLSLSLARLPDGAARAAQLEGLEPFSVGEALEVLAEGRSEPGCALRPAVVRRLVDLATVGAEAVGGVEAEVSTLHRALAAEAGVDGIDAAASRLDRRYSALVSGPAGDGAESIDGVDPDGYVASVAETLGLPVETVGPPSCADEQSITWGGHDGYLVQATWWTSMSINQLRPWTNPRNWPSCSHRTFFKSMDEIPGTYQRGTGMPAGATKWKGDWSVQFDETVMLDELITTRLGFEHFERDAEGGTAGPITYVWTDYHLADPAAAGELVIDHGTIEAQAVPLGDGRTLTKVLLTKNYGFRSAKYQQWPTLACDTFFGETAMMMATNCHQPNP